MTTTRPVVSILIPTFNRRRYLEQTVASALSLRGPEIELIVSDNASSDDTPVYLAGLSDRRIRSFRQATNLGMVGNWNFCVREAIGEYVLLLSDDDLLMPDALEELLRPLRDTRVAFSYGRVNVIDGQGAHVRLSPPSPAFEDGRAYCRSRLQELAFPYPCGVLLRRSDLVAIGGYPPIGNLADVAVELVLASRGGAVAYICKPIAAYRRHAASLTMDPLRWLRGLVALHRFAVERLPSLRRDLDAYLRHAVMYRLCVDCAARLELRRSPVSWRAVDSPASRLLARILADAPRRAARVTVASIARVRRLIYRAQRRALR